MSDLLKDLARAKANFQLRAITATMGIELGEIECHTCGDHHKADEVPFVCETGDGV